MSGQVLNALTIDVEDGRQLLHWKMTGDVIPPSPKVVCETESLLAILSAHNVRATFFVLSNVAETFPDLVRRIDDAGHEIASHGLSHSLVYRQSPAQFREETRRAKDLLQAIIGKPIYGYRAAEFSITKRSWWALDILAEEGFVYDSSIYPIAGKRYGVASFPLEPHGIRTRQNNAILEFPLTAIERWGRRWPVAGGGYFQFSPYWLTRAAIREVNQRGRPAVVYLHPYEFADNKLKLRVPLSKLSPRACFVYIRHSTIRNFARESLRHRFIRLLHDFRFVPIKELVQNVQIDKRVL